MDGFGGRLRRPDTPPQIVILSEAKDRHVLTRLFTRQFTRFTRQLTRPRA